VWELKAPLEETVTGLLKFRYSRLEAVQRSLEPLAAAEKAILIATRRVGQEDTMKLLNPIWG
jgi:hypothetical protein